MGRFDSLRRWWRKQRSGDAGGDGGTPYNFGGDSVRSHDHGGHSHGHNGSADSSISDSGGSDSGGGGDGGGGGD